MKKIFLVGFMGSGKSSVGKLLAERLRTKFVDLDEYMVEKTGLTIPEIFENYGEKFFRNLEKKALIEISNSPTIAVVATGGGIVEDEENRRILKSNLTFYLSAPWEEVWSRISGDENRPLVKKGEKVVRKLYEKREKLYRESGKEVNTAHMSVEEVVEELMEIIEREW